MNKKNEGKIFEDCFAKSCPNHVWVKKLADNASGWSGGKKSSFSTGNECDYIMHDEKSGILYGLELKSTKGTHFTFWREDIEDRCKTTNFIIGKRQILGLKKWNKNHKGVFGFVLNFRTSGNPTYFVFIDSFIDYTNKLTKASINESDIKNMGGIFIPSKKLKVNYRYNTNEFFDNMTSIIK